MKHLTDVRNIVAVLALMVVSVAASAVTVTITDQYSTIQFGSSTSGMTSSASFLLNGNTETVLGSPYYVHGLWTAGAYVFQWASQTDTGTLQATTEVFGTVTGGTPNSTYYVKLQGTYRGRGHAKTSSTSESAVASVVSSAFNYTTGTISGTSEVWATKDGTATMATDLTQVFYVAVYLDGNGSGNLYFADGAAAGTAQASMSTYYWMSASASAEIGFAGYAVVP